jgi:hypothetical protein
MKLTERQSFSSDWRRPVQDSISLDDPFILFIDFQKDYRR